MKYRNNGSEPIVRLAEKRLVLIYINWIDLNLILI